MSTISSSSSLRSSQTGSNFRLNTSGYSISQSLRCDTKFRSDDGPAVEPRFHPKYRRFTNADDVTAPPSLRHSSDGPLPPRLRPSSGMTSQVFPQEDFRVVMEGRSSNLQFWGDTLSVDSLVPPRRTRSVSESSVTGSVGHRPKSGRQRRYNDVIPSYGDRTEIPLPTTTQKNKHVIGPKGFSEAHIAHSTGIAPRRPADIAVSDVIKYQDEETGGFEKAAVRYVGHLPGRSHVFVGVELRAGRGRHGGHDGVYNNQRFFQCAPRRGAFVPFDKVRMVYKSDSRE